MKVAIYVTQSILSEPASSLRASDLAMNLLMADVEVDLYVDLPAVINLVDFSDEANLQLVLQSDLLADSQYLTLNQQLQSRLAYFLTQTQNQWRMLGLEGLEAMNVVMQVNSETVSYSMMTQPVIENTTVNGKNTVIPVVKDHMQYTILQLLQQGITCHFEIASQISQSELSKVFTNYNLVFTF